MKNNKLLTTLLATTTLTSILSVIAPQEATARASFVRACKDGNTGNALIYYNHNGVEKAIYGEPNSNGRVNTDEVKNQLTKGNVGLSDSEANSVKNGIPNSKIRDMQSCADNLSDSLSDFPIYRGSISPTDFHSVTNSNGDVGADAFQQFANTEASALDLSTLNARKLDATQLNLTYDNDVKIYFINEGAGYKNQLQVQTTGNTLVSGMVFKDVSCHTSDDICQGKWSSPADVNKALKPGDYVDLGTLSAGTRLDFQVLANGYSNSNPDVWHTDDSLNSDGIQHVIAYAYEGYLILAWEDLNANNPSNDYDYNDVIFALYIGSDNLAAIPSDPAASNNTPSAVDDSATTPYETAVTIDVLNNDTDADGDVLTLDSIESDPANGSVSISGDSVIYTPNTGFSGTDSFEYNVTDTQGATDTATVTVAVEEATEEGASCGNNGHGNNAPVTYNWGGGKLTIGQYDPSNPSGQQTSSIISALTLGTIGRVGNGNGANTSWIEFVDGTDSPSYRMTLEEATELVNNHPDWEITGRGATTILECPSNDYDNDGINDAVELGDDFNNPLDTDGDGTPDYAQPDESLDSDGNDIPDAVEGTGDSDGDGTPDYLDPDNDGNGTPDTEDSKEDGDGDGTPDYSDLDDDNDGIEDTNDDDIDGDGITNIEEDSPTIPSGFTFPTRGSADDIDGDGVVNSLDPDSDGNGVDDVDENNGDYNGDGTPDFPTGFNFPTGISADDVDGDGLKNSLDPNNDNDDLTDEEEEEYGSNPMVPDIYLD